MNETLFFWDFPGGTAGLCAAGALLLILCINTGDIKEIDYLPIRISILLTIFRVIRAIFVPFFRRNNFQSCAGTR